MKKLPILLLILLSVSNTGVCQKFKLLSKKDIIPAIAMVVAGYSTGVRDEVLYHPNQLFEQYPNLNRKFWDNRVQSEPGFLNMEWNADHVFKGVSVLSFCTAVTFRLGEKQKWYLYIWDGLRFLAFYKIGFIASYHLQFKNKL
jgi:hypothetical protein